MHGGVWVGDIAGTHVLKVVCVLCVCICMYVGMEVRDQVLCILGHRISICVFMLIHIKYLSNFIG
jgi:hypothetical protein